MQAAALASMRSTWSMRIHLANIWSNLYMILLVLCMYMILRVDTTTSVFNGESSIIIAGCQGNAKWQVSAEMPVYLSIPNGPKFVMSYLGLPASYGCPLCAFLTMHIIGAEVMVSILGSWSCSTGLQASQFQQLLKLEMLSSPSLSPELLDIICCLILFWAWEIPGHSGVITALQALQMPHDASCGPAVHHRLQCY